MLVIINVDYLEAATRKEENVRTFLLKQQQHRKKKMFVL
jgi:hypothetical protein